jgi:UDPglucose--hexose-1-phosphate uridylyltransferase
MANRNTSAEAGAAKDRSASSGAPASQLRYDVTADEWIVFAPSRASRPHAPSPRTGGDGVEACPFCPGNERLSPDEVFRLDDAKGDWQVRVVRNEYPALVPSIPPGQRELSPVFREMCGHGEHEVVIESPEHSRPASAQSLDQMVRVLRVVRERFLALSASASVRAVAVFKNHGAGAGTSLAHPHWQILAMPVVPGLLRVKQAVATKHFERTARCPYVEVLEEELAAGVRVLATNDEYVAFLPYASRVPYQVRILPRRFASSFGRVSVDRLAPLAEVLQLVLSRIGGVLNDPDFNLALCTTPPDEECARSFLWHIDVLPRLEATAGLELGSGMAINAVFPEEAARVLRGAPPPAAVPHRLVGAS